MRMPALATRPIAEPLDILIVDDEPDTCELLSEFCTTQGLRVATAFDGLAAVNALERAQPPFPIVIADLHLPSADGFQVLEAARRANGACYVIIVTGYATIDSAVRAVRAGAYDFLAKPFALGQLEVLLARIRDRMALERENRHLTRQIGDEARATFGVRGGGIDARLRLLEERVASLERRLMSQA
jgi:DNA-binding NtrC family response regulator